MTRMATILTATASAALLSACVTTEAQENNETAVQTMGVFAAEESLDTAWPPAGCPDGAALVEWMNNPANANYKQYYGVYSGGTNPTSDGNVFWIGSNHGQNIIPPNQAISIPPTPQGQAYMIRWNISDEVQGGGRQAGSAVSNNYAWDTEASGDWWYAYDALAINTCETVADPQPGGPNVGNCQQPIFGEAAWKDDIQNGSIDEFCPPMMFASDLDSVYLFDQNNDAEIEVYEYSLRIKSNVPGPRGGMPIIIDPKISNGGVGRGNR